VVPVDEETGELGARIDAGRNAFAGLAYGEGGLWVGHPDEGVVRRIDPDSGRVVRTIRIPTGVAYGASTVATGGGAVWVLGSTADQSNVARIDPADDTVTRSTVPVETDDESAIAVSADAAWVTSSEDAVIRLGFR
jgi:streptogramin lyase